MKKLSQYIPIIFVLFLIYLITISVLRYTQRNNNIEMKNQINHFSSYQAFSPPLNYKEENLLEGFQNYKKDLNHSNENINSTKLLRLASFSNKINNNFLETKFSNKLLKSNGFYPTDEQNMYLHDILIRSIYKEMNCGNYENARYRAQRLINNSNLFMPMERSLTYARKILKLTKNNLYGFDIDLIRVLNNISYYDDSTYGEKNKKTILTTLEAHADIDFIPYYIYDILENNLSTTLEKQQLWQDFENKYKNNIFLEEAIYNQLLYSLKSQEKLFVNDENYYKEFSNRFYKKTSFFLKNFANSYLKDDVLYLAIIFATFETNINELKKNYKLLRYNNTTYLSMIENRFFNKFNGFNYTKFIVDAIDLESNITFKEYSSKTLPFEESYLKKLKRELFKNEGENYSLLSLETILKHIILKNRNNNE